MIKYNELKEIKRAFRWFCTLENNDEYITVLQKYVFHLHRGGDEFNFLIFYYTLQISIKIAMEKSDGTV